MATAGRRTGISTLAIPWSVPPEAFSVRWPMRPIAQRTRSRGIVAVMASGLAICLSLAAPAHADVITTNWEVVDNGPDEITPYYECSNPGFRPDERICYSLWNNGLELVPQNYIYGDTW